MDFYSCLPFNHLRPLLFASMTLSFGWKREDEQLVWLRLTSYPKGLTSFMHQQFQNCHIMRANHMWSRYPNHKNGDAEGKGSDYSKVLIS